MTLYEVWKDTYLNPDTNELFVKWLDKPIITENVSDAAQEWANEYCKQLEDIWIDTQAKIIDKKTEKEIYKKFNR